MVHYLRNGENSFQIKVEMGCNRPDFQNICSGKCQDCPYSYAKTTISEMMDLLKLADCDYIN